MTQKIKSSTPTINTPTVHHTQVAPQEKNKYHQQDFIKEKQMTDNKTLSSPPPSPPQLRKTNNKNAGSKHGFLSLLFCCMSDTSALIDPHAVKTANNNTTTTTTTPTSNVRVKRKKKQWYRRWYSTSKSSPDKENDPASRQYNNNHQEQHDQQQKNVIITDENKKTIDQSTTTTIPNNNNNNNNNNTSKAPLKDVTNDPLYPIDDSNNFAVPWLLPPISNEHTGRKCLVLDLDETLLHSSFKAIPNPDFIVPVEIDNQYHNVYVLKRPGVDEFMRKMGEIYEIVIFTASLSKYADPVLDMLDIHRVVKHRLFRESCFNHKGSYVKDLSKLGRDLAATLILDNSPTSYLFHTSNAVPVSTWFNDPHDTELTDLVDFLNDLTYVEDVTLILDNNIDPSSSVTVK
ncbi:HAD-like domain-containing protein [Cunninghamella echinulata]|nr:HAD-like domain-containing protein [Cunninghamella echinulata]